jgi:hypothetical protein
MIELESMAVEMPEVEGHPNRTAFCGVLTVVDVASQRAPSGSSGRRVVLTRKAAEEALPSLLGMALDYAPTYDRHDQRRKVGVITSAEIVGRDLEVGGYLYAKDFPEVVEEIGRNGRRSSDVRRRTSDIVGRGDSWKARTPTLGKARKVGHPRSGVQTELAAAVERLREMTARITGRKISILRASVEVDASGAPGLGMSFEVANVIADRRLRIWTLTKVTFTGAAILRRNRAAYEDTWIELV